MYVSNSYHFQKFISNVSQWVFRIWACTDILHFKYSGVKMFVLKFVSQLLNLAKEISLHFENINKMQTGFSRSGILLRSGIQTLFTSYKHTWLRADIFYFYFTHTESSWISVRYLVLVKVRLKISNYLLSQFERGCIKGTVMQIIHSMELFYLSSYFYIRAFFFQQSFNVD